MTEIERLFYKAGEYAGKAAVYRKLRAKTKPGEKWLEYDNEERKNMKKSARFFTRAVKLSCSREHVNNSTTLQGGEA